MEIAGEDGFRIRSYRNGATAVEGYPERVAELMALFRATPGVDAVTPAGSLRRGRETVGDLDLLVTGPHSAAALDAFVAWPRVDEVLGHGENKASAKVCHEGLQVDVRAL